VTRTGMSRWRRWPQFHAFTTASRLSVVVMKKHVMVAGSIFQKRICLTLAVMQVNATQMEARVLLRQTCSHVPNLNSYFLTYLRSNHDVTVLIDAAHKMRYAMKYAAKSGRHSELLNEVIKYLNQRSMDLIPTNMQHVLSQLLLADVSHRAFMSKQVKTTTVVSRDGSAAR